MKLFAKTEYACVAMMELAMAANRGEPLRIRDIATQQGIPARFLVQILLQLKGAGLVVSTRGAAGGYQLALPAEKITLWQVIQAVEGNDPVQSSTPHATPVNRVILNVWRELNEKEAQLLSALTIAKLVEKSQSEREEMYYI
ncbi:MAG: Rrf2 family transcriptional regulator [Pirellulales bacterium]|nr:Rrf2 family transcriptional regulator [Pirellulales bacterium]